MKKYSITYHNEFDEKYYNADERCIHRSEEQYSDISKEVCLDALKSFLDAPDEELTEDSIRKDFGSIHHPISEDDVQKIKTFYNGRKELYGKILKEFDTIGSVPARFNIPEKFNMWSFDEDDTKQVSSYIEIRMT